ncbi:MAG TPA: threonine synthase, partial [Micromonosporaceae bacterium]
MSYLIYLECPRCGRHHDAMVPANLCDCGSPLLARYDLAAAAAAVTPADIAGRGADLWRYHEVLPVSDPANVVTLGEGFTPMLPAARYGAAVGVPGL